jgi:peptide/nickel transport system ATP-binding protein
VADGPADGPLLDIRGLKIEATSTRPASRRSNVTLVHGVDVTLQKRQGAGPDRRIRRRQIDHRPVGHGLRPRRRAADRRRRPSSTAATSCGGPRQLRKLRGARSPMSRNRRPPAFNPAKRLMEQVIEATLRTA